MDLMLYFDGELSPEEQAEVRAALAEAGDGDEARKLASLGQVGETVRTSLELDTDDVDHRLGAELWDLVERRITANGQAEAAVAAPARAPASDGGAWAAVRRWLASNRGHLLTSAVTAGAVAVLILVFRPPTERVIEKPGAERIVHVPAASMDPVVPVSSEPAAVEELSVNDGTGYILTIPGDGSENDTTVIWIEPDENVEGPL